MGERTCSVDGCDKPVKARGWCGNHYMQWRRTGEEPYGVPVPCNTCGRVFRPLGANEHKMCWTCRRANKLNWSSRACAVCGEEFTPRKAAKVARACDACHDAARADGVSIKRLADPERYRELAKRYADRNPGYQRDWARRNPNAAKQLRLRERAARRARDEADPTAATERRRVQRERRRARKRRVEYEPFDRREVFDRDGWVCSICYGAIDPALKWPNPLCVSLDHVIPLAKQGAHTRANSAAAHLICNQRKAVSLPA